MDEQLDFFSLPTEPSDPVETVYAQLLPALEDVLRRYWLPPSAISLTPCKSYHSIGFGTSVIARIRPLIKKPPRIETPIVVNSEKDNWDEWPLQNLKVTYRHKAVVCYSLEQAIKTLPKDFDCCSRYLDCSDAQRCIHPDTAAMMGCGYWRVMASGKIYYGKNRNI